MKKVTRLMLCFVGLIGLSQNLSAATLSGFYSAKLDTNKGIKVFLHQEENKLYGYFGYDNDMGLTYIPNAQTVFGSLEPGNYIVLKHVGSKGEAHLFEGFLDEKNHSLKGDWLYPASEAVELKPIVVNLGQGLTVDNKHIEESDVYYHLAVSANLPHISSSLDLTPEIKAFNQHVEDVIFKLKSEFKRDVIRSEARENVDYYGESTLSIDHEITYATYPLISVRFNVSTYYAGAIHALNSSITINYDLEKGHALKFGSMFKKYSLFLKELADLSRTHLQSTLPQDFTSKKQAMLVKWITNGTEARDANFQSWNLTNLGFLISFDPYQVAPYALGRQEIIVPYALLSDEFDNKYQMT